MTGSSFSTYQDTLHTLADGAQAADSAWTGGKIIFIGNGVMEARRREAGIVTLSGFNPDNPLRKLGGINFFVDRNVCGLVETAHVTPCHAMLDLAMGWPSITVPVSARKS